MLDAREDIPSKRLGIEIHLTEGFWRKIYGRKNSFVAAPTTKVKTTFNLTSKTSPKVYLYIHQNYEDLIILLGKFNVGINYSYMENLCDICDLKSLKTEPECYKNHGNSTILSLL